MKKILVVDDEDALRDFLVRIIQREGFQAIGAADGQEALKLCQEQRPDYIFLDLHMEKMGGLEVLEEIKKLDSTPGVFILTGDENFIIQNSPEKIGIEKYIKKPISPAEIRDLLTNLAP